MADLWNYEKCAEQKARIEIARTTLDSIMNGMPHFSEPDLEVRRDTWLKQIEHMGRELRDLSWHISGQMIHEHKEIDDATADSN